MKAIITLALLFISTLSVSAQTIIYVDSAATGLNDGSSWANAYTDLQDAFNSFQLGKRIWVANGTYYPTKNEFGGPPSNSDKRVFKIKQGMKLYGGFNGTETHHAQRDRSKNKTILSGLNPTTVGAAPSNSVVLFDQLTSTTTMDGFIIKHGADRGVWTRGGNPRLSNLIVTENSGGIEVHFGSPLIINCVIRDNPIYSSLSSGIKIGDPTTFIPTTSAQPVIANCLIVNNSGGAFSAGIYVSSNSSTPCEPIIINTTIANNVATSPNNQIRSVGSAVHTKVYNCVIGGKAGLGISGQTTFYNSLIPNSGSSTTWDASIGLNGGGNIDSWPFFVDSANGDYTLQHCSPAINAGQNTILPQDELDLDNDGIYTETLPIDLGGGLRQVGTVDMGAYEFTHSDPLLQELCLGDSLAIGDSIITSHGIHTIYFPDSGRCDSMVIVDVQKMVEAKIALTPDSLTYYAVDSNASYQWYDCANHYVLPADTNQSFTPWIPSSYRVIVTKNGCVDTSGCIVVNKVNLAEPGNHLQLKVYPNPSSGVYNLQLWGHVTDLQVRLVDLSGKIILQHDLSNANSDTIDLSHAPTGIYLLFVNGEGFAETIRLVKE